MSKKHSVKSAVDAARRQERAHTRDSEFRDSFQNFQAKLGLGTDNLMSGSTYGFNPISRIRTLLEWIYRGNWIGGVAVNVIADDMTRGGIELKGQLHPGDTETLDEAAVELGIWPKLNNTIKWSRLYGGCLAVLLIDGQDPRTPLREESIGPGQFKGLLVLDRWMVTPSLQDLVTEYGPSMGLPRYYTVTADAPALPRMTIHHSRCIRLEGLELPYWQKLTENLWGLSVLEPLYDRMVAFDSASTGAAQLVYKSYLRTLKVQGLTDIIASGGPQLDGIAKYVSQITRYQGIEGMTMIDGNDELEIQGHTAFSGLSDALLQFGQQISGALQVPLVRLFGQSPAGLNSSGDSDLRTYYDGIKQRQEQSLRVGITKVYRILARSLKIELPDGFRLEFRPLWQLSETEKADIGAKTTDAIVKAFEAGLISARTALEELRAASHICGIYSTITDEDIEAASEELLPAIPEGETVKEQGDIELPETLVQPGGAE
jgi:hypothetical protein